MVKFIAVCDASVKDSELVEVMNNENERHASSYHHAVVISVHALLCARHTSLVFMYMLCLLKLLTWI